MIQTFLPDRICLCFPFPEFFFDLLIGFFRLFEVYGKPEYKNDYPALLVELKWNQNAQTALTQIKTKKYPSSILNYTGDILLVGINYDKNSKKHQCIIEKYRKN